MKASPEAETDDLAQRLASLQTITIPIAYLDSGVSQTSKGDFKFSLIVPAEFDEVMMRFGRIRGIPITLTVERWDNAQSDEPSPD